MKPWHVAIVSGEPLMRLGLAYLLKVDAGFQVVGETASPAEAVQCVESHLPELVVLDLVLPHADGLVLIKDLHRISPKTGIIVLTAIDDIQTVQRAFRAGARGYLLKSDDPQEVLAAVSAVRHGGRHASRRVASGLLDSLSSGNMAWKRDENISSLSDRELQVFRLIGGGMCGTAISRELGVSVKTVETHRQRIKEKLRLQNGAQLAQKAVAWLDADRASTQKNSRAKS